MIEFKGAFYKSKTSPSQLVLVQFDGVLLHIWNISSPFHRILSSEVFKLPLTPGRHRRWVKLPNGSRIETDDIQALDLLKSSCHPTLAVRIRLFFIQWNISIVFSALVAALTLGLITYCLFVA